MNKKRKKKNKSYLKLDANIQTISIFIKRWKRYSHINRIADIKRMGQQDFTTS